MYLKLKVALDANCFIAYYNAQNHSQVAVRRIFSFWRQGGIDLFVSLKTIDELSCKPDQCFALANQVSKLPNYPVGTWDDAVGSWKDQAGTWADAKGNQHLQQLIHQLAKKGADIRDRGAFLDAVLADMDFFITHDPHLSGSGPAQRLAGRFNTRVMTPSAFIATLESGE